MENKIEYLKLFKTEKEYNTFVGNDTSVNPYVALCEDTEDVYFNTKKDTAGIEYVDLGLPSGTLWATKNVGASNTEDYGMLFTWGGVNGAKVTVNNEGKFQFGTEYTFGTYGTMIEKEIYNETKGGWQIYTRNDNFTKLLPKHDAARHHMKGSWHLPSKAQVQELIDNCYCGRRVVGSKIEVMRYTSKVDNNNYVDFPICGYATEGGMQEIDNNALYFMWTNELYVAPDSSDNEAYTFGANKIFESGRVNGLLCRGVIGQIIEE